MSDENLGYNPTLDEIVFENRNKAYGAYDLRQSYRGILTKAFVIGTLLFCLFAATPFIMMKIKQLTAPEKVEVEANLVEILPEEKPIIEQPKEEEPPPPPPPPKQEEEKIEIIQNVVPEPVKAPKVETPPPPISKQLETTTGLVNQEGVKKPTYSPPPPPPSTGKANTVEVKPQVSKTEVYERVDQEAEFSGGGDAGFRRAFQDNFDTSVMDGDEGNVKTDLTFVVEIDGSLTQVKATGSNSTFNREAERAIKSIKKKWKPAKINGEPVRSRFRMPVVMNFE
ncbi:energy transducer TonB [Riemerella columbina]|uniref:energy transducer TonB n=1 Tax=Riemerella columbina TaxID=103810 RepID=UPI00267060E5|nr:energy transducer TonB [Riemerella columbina]WKS95085.1 energy transducer TonB [Riemerella columbina]